MTINGTAQSPPEMLRMVLTSAKKMDVPFEDAWPRALRRARTLAGQNRAPGEDWAQAKASWHRALEDMKSEWQAAYENRETELSRAFAGIR